MLSVQEGTARGLEEVQNEALNVESIIVRITQQNNVSVPKSSSVLIISVVLVSFQSESVRNVADDLVFGGCCQGLAMTVQQLASEGQNANVVQPPFAV